MLIRVCLFVRNNNIVKSSTDIRSTKFRRNSFTNFFGGMLGRIWYTIMRSFYAFCAQNTQKPTRVQSWGV